ncbi:MAG: DnaJ domain-containing protein [Gammaproteobacteria bacterium]
MNQILIIAGIIGLLLFLRWIRKQPRNKQIQGFLILAAIVLIGLALAGRLNWLFAVGAAAAASFQKLIGLLRYAPLFKSIFSNQTNHNPETGDKEHSVNTSTKMSKEEAYKILGLNENATKEEIIEAHRKLIQKIHPDRGGNDYLASQINQAKDYLLNKIV